MDFPKNASKIRTEMIMQNIKQKMYNGEMRTGEYNNMYSIIYDTLEKISIQNLAKAPKEMNLDINSKYK